MILPDTLPTPPGLFRGKAWFWLPILPLLALDLWSKAASFAFLAARSHQPDERFWRYSVWSPDAPVTFDLVAWRNTGTVWGFGQEFTTALVVLRCLALMLIIYFAWRLPVAARARQFVLAMIMAGALGNLYDNFTEVSGGVRDFLLFSANFGGEPLSFPAFNVADSCICVGAFALAVALWRGGEEAGPASDVVRS